MVSTASQQVILASDRQRVTGREREREKER